MDAHVSFRLDFDRIVRAIDGLHQATGTLANSAGLTADGTAILLAALQAAAPTRTGRLRDSIVVRVDGDGRRFFGAPYAAFVVGGTKPHLILPRTRRALFWPGARHPVRQVRHPGTKPNDFPTRAVEHASPALRVLLLDSGRQVVRLIKGNAT